MGNFPAQGCCCYVGVQGGHIYAAKFQVIAVAVTNKVLPVT